VSIYLTNWYFKARSATMSGVPPEPLTPDRRRALTRTHLLAAAAEVFAKRGYHGATLDEVAELAGFSKGAVYSNFSSKEALFLALLEQSETELVAAFAAAAGPEAEPSDTMQSIRAVYAGSTNEERDRNWRLWTEFTLHALRDPASHERLAESQRLGHAAVVALVERQCESAGIVPSIAPELLARIYTAVFTGLWAQQVADPDGVDDDAFAEAVVFIAQAVEALGRPRKG
jgi:AcrR family transcriptional regulator